MRGFSVASHARDGALFSRLDGTEARHFPDTDTYELDAPRVRRIDAQGRVMLASARTGAANADAAKAEAARAEAAKAEAMKADAAKAGAARTDAAKVA